MTRQRLLLKTTLSILCCQSIFKRRNTNKETDCRAVLIKIQIFSNHFRLQQDNSYDFNTNTHCTETIRNQKSIILGTSMQNFRPPVSLVVLYHGFSSNPELLAQIQRSDFSSSSHHQGLQQLIQLPHPWRLSLATGYFFEPLLVKIFFCSSQHWCQSSKTPKSSAYPTITYLVSNLSIAPQKMAIPKMTPIPAFFCKIVEVEVQTDESMKIIPMTSKSHEKINFQVSSEVS